VPTQRVADNDLVDRAFLSALSRLLPCGCPETRPTALTLGVPKTAFAAVDLPLRPRRENNLIRQWHCS
jgi:hypothetical protein